MDSGSTLLPESMLSGAQKGSILRKITRGNSKASILAPKSFNRRFLIPSIIGLLLIKGAHPLQNTFSLIDSVALTYSNRLVKITTRGILYL